MLKVMYGTLLLWVMLAASGLTAVYAASNPPEQITDWRIRWDARDGGAVHPPADDSLWLEMRGDNATTKLPKPHSGAWVSVKLPEMKWSSPALYIETLYALKVKVYVEDRLVYENSRNYIKDHYSLLVPLGVNDAGKNLYIWTGTLQERAGIKEAPVIGEHSEMVDRYIKNGLVDVILGCSFIFVALVLFVCSFFLNRDYFSAAASLSVVIASTGLLAITYSPFVYSFYGYLGPASIVLFDLGLLSLLPALTFLFEKIFGGGKYGLIRHFRRFQVAYSAFCVLCMAINGLSGNRYVELYYFVSTRVIGYIMIFQFVLLIGCVLIYSLKGNKDAIIFAVGFGTAALTGVIELIWYFARSSNYDLFYWKWALVVFILSLIVILGRRLALNHRQVVQYSQELEMFNNELQRSEKMEIISELAASVAHEVRNPLQVTRGFLQLLEQKTDGDERKYLTMALSELDRASGIITDFLTFAKPEFEQVTVLNVHNEFTHIESILLPLCHLNGGKMVLDVAEGLWVKGNSSKFKQAFINIIKNSIEALNGEGMIQVLAYAKGDKAIIRIRDNGEGMEPEVLGRLGEPYFSNKTKGTGLGLMVTFRIIEAMSGEIQFYSKKGAGTESVIQLPLTAV